MFKELFNSSLQWSRRLEVVVPWHFCDTRPDYVIRGTTKFEDIRQLLRLILSRQYWLPIEKLSKNTAH